MPPNSDKPTLKRRSFLSLLPGAFAGAACLPFIPSFNSESQDNELPSPARVCWIEQNGGRKVRDEVSGIINIGDQAMAGQPALEGFASGGLLARIRLDEMPPFGCHHYLLSDLASGKICARDLTLRLVDERATLLMSVVHLDYVRRDFALNHGSDRFSTFNDYPCNPST